MNNRKQDNEIGRMMKKQFIRSKIFRMHKIRLIELDKQLYRLTILIEWIECDFTAEV